MRIKKPKPRKVQKLTRESHGMSSSPIYAAWKDMKRRCLNKNDKYYRIYKDFKICDQWINSFVCFYRDMGDRPAGMSLDRIDGNLGYFPENCRWANNETQARNKRTRTNTGIRYISKVKNTKYNYYGVTIRCKGKKYNRLFKEMKDAISYKEKCIEEISKVLTKEEMRYYLM